MSVGIRVDGVKKVQADLTKLGITARTKIVNLAGRTGADMFRKEMLARVPIGETGNLRKGIRTRQIKNGLAWQAVSRAPHAYLVEFGNTRTRPRVHKSGKSVGNMPPNRFTTAAFEARKRTVERTLSKLIAREIEREAAE